MEGKINPYLRCKIKELISEDKYLIAIKILKKIKITNDDSFDIKYFINYNLAFCYMQLERYFISGEFITKAENLFTKDKDMIINILYGNYDYKKLIKLKEELDGRVINGKINCYNG